MKIQEIIQESIQIDPNEMVSNVILSRRKRMENLWIFYDKRKLS